MGKRIAIVGAGAAGCFCALNLKRLHPECHVSVYESGTKALAKVAITGGGRCNLTNSWENVKSLGQVYPRGEKLLKKLFKQFSPEDTRKWWEKEGVRLVSQPDGCIFPQSQDAMQIVNTLLTGMRLANVELHLSHRVKSISHPSADSSYTLTFSDESKKSIEADVVIVTTGGSPKIAGFTPYTDLGIEVTPPVPSLFTFCIDTPGLKDLQGIVVEHTTTILTGTKYKAEGPLLITHWGMSGPAILKLSSQGARWLAEHDYKGEVMVNWLPDLSQDEVRAKLEQHKATDNGKMVANTPPDGLTKRHWAYMLSRIGIAENKRWSDVGKKELNKMTEMLSADCHTITGKGQYKEEFVTCGGISLGELDSNTLECKKHPNLYFAGEITDVDGVTGGFNLQAAWTMGMVIARAVGNK
ncbi:MAG: NAD(P)/FAD-dependent oxidoreductase [Paludibacteraceae bacterium]|nr:NAD(P)/FAD-dependent oxidoreductase [Paludibacteraceae bacterium]